VFENWKWVAYKYVIWRFYMPCACALFVNRGDFMSELGWNVRDDVSESEAGWWK